MSAPELGTSERSARPAGVAHLLTADDSLAKGNRYGTYLALCGARVPASGLPSSLCPPGCAGDCALYCPQCVHHVVQYAVESGEDEADLHDELHDDEPEPEPWGRFVGECGHSRAINHWGHIGSCPCDTPSDAEPPDPEPAASDGLAASPRERDSCHGPEGDRTDAVGHSARRLPASPRPHGLPRNVRQ